MSCTALVTVAGNSIVLLNVCIIQDLWMDNSSIVRGKVRGWVNFCTWVMDNVLVVSCRSLANLAVVSPYKTLY